MKETRKKAFKPSKPIKKTNESLRHASVFAFLCLSVSLAYSGSLQGTWALDDTAVMKSINIEELLNLQTGNRKIAYLSFLINKWINPFDPVNYRVTNIIIHILNAVLVYCVAFTTLRLPGWKEKFGSYAFPVAFTSSVLFALHPININSVTYIVQRMTSLATMFVLLALLSYVFARKSEGRFQTTFAYLAALLCLLLGLSSKENAVMGIPLILLYEYVFLSKGNLKGSSMKKVAGIAAVLLVLGFLAVLFLYYKGGGYLINTFLKFNSPIVGQTWSAQDIYWTPYQHILTEFRVIGRYIFLLFLPLPGFLVFDWWGFPVSTGIFEPLSTLLASSMIIGILLISVFKVRKLPFLSFGILWYFIALSLESFIALGLDLYFEHRNYLPLTGLFIGVVAQVMFLFKESALKEKNIWISVLLLSVVLGTLTFQRNLVWKDSITLWKDSVDKTSGNLRAMMSLGNAYYKEYNLTSAGHYYETVFKTSAKDKRAIFFNDSGYCLGMVHLFMGDLDKAKKVIDVLDTALENSYRSGILKGLYYSKKGNLEEALNHYNRVLPKASDLDSVVIHKLLGDAYNESDIPDQAIEHYEKAIQSDPAFSDAYYGLGAAYLKMRDIGKAVYYMEKTLALEDDHVLALSDMSDIILITRGPAEKALSYAKKAVLNSPQYYQPYLAMGNILIAMGKEKDSELFFKKARELGVKEYMLLLGQTRAYYLRGDIAKVKLLLEQISQMKDVPQKVQKIVNESLKLTGSR